MNLNKVSIIFFFLKSNQLGDFKINVMVKTRNDAMKRNTIISAVVSSRIFQMVAGSGINTIPRSYT